MGGSAKFHCVTTKIPQPAFPFPPTKNDKSLIRKFLTFLNAFVSVLTEVKYFHFLRYGFPSSPSNPNEEPLRQICPISGWFHDTWDGCAQFWTIQSDLGRLRPIFKRFCPILDASVWFWMLPSNFGRPRSFRRVATDFRFVCLISDLSIGFRMLPRNRPKWKMISLE